MPADEQNSLMGMLDNYRNAFERLVALDEKIGLTSHSNLSASLNDKSEEIESLFVTLNAKSFPYPAVADKKA